jgi:hypothetical protein
MPVGSTQLGLGRLPVGSAVAQRAASRLPQLIRPAGNLLAGQFPFDGTHFLTSLFAGTLVIDAAIAIQRQWMAGRQ